MAKSPVCDLIQEKVRLFAALNALYRYWGTAEMVPAYEHLLYTIGGAERALALSPLCNESEGMTLRVEVRNVESMLPYALYEVMRLERYTSAEPAQQARAEPVSGLYHLPYGVR